MIPNDYDLWLERNRPALTATAERSAPTSEQVRVASAVGHIESAQAEVAKARCALVAADLDPSGLDLIRRELDGELTWLCGGGQ